MITGIDKTSAKNWKKVGFISEKEIDFLYKISEILQKIVVINTQIIEKNYTKIVYRLALNVKLLIKHFFK